MTTTSGLPPGIRVTPLNVWRFLASPLGALEDCQEKFGRTFTVVMPKEGPLVITSNPEAVRDIFAAPPDGYGVQAPEFFGRFLGPNALNVAVGEKHKRQRKLMMPAFHGARMRAYADTIQQIAWEHAKDWKVGAAVNVRETAHAISCEVIIRTIFGVIEPERVRRFTDAVMAYTKSMRPMLIYFPPARVSLLGRGPWAHYKKMKAEVERLIDEQIEIERRAATSSESVLAMLLGARDENGEPMTHDEIHDEMLLMLFAGQESTAESLTWAFYSVGRHPEVRARLAEELRSLGERPEAAALATLPYLEAVCNETLRLYPVATTVSRLLTRPMALDGSELPAGVGIGASVWLIHQSHDLYPEPTRFRPERFLERKYSASEFIPFGGGFRKCLGAAFALYEMKIVLGSLLARYQLSPIDGAPVKPVLRNFIIGPDRDVVMRCDEVPTEPPASLSPVEPLVERALGGMERLYWHANRAAKNHCVGFGDIRGPLTGGALRQGLSTLQARHPLLRVRIVDEGGSRIFFRTGGVPAIPLREVERPENELEAEIDRELEGAFPAEGPLARCVWVRHGEDRSTLILSLSHVIGDGMSLAYMIRDILDVAGRAISGEAVPSLPPLQPRAEIERYLPKEAFGTKGALQLVKSFSPHATKGPPRQLAEGRRVPANQRRSRIIIRQLDRSFTEPLAQHARAKEATVHGALCAAVLLAIAEDVGQGSGRAPCLACGAPVDLRRRIEPPPGEAIGFNVSVLPFVDRVDPKTPFWELARHVRKSSVAALERGDHLALAMMSGLQARAADVVGTGPDGASRLARLLEKAGTPTVAVSNIGNLPIPSAYGPLELVSFGICAGASVTSRFVTFASTVRGSLVWAFVHSDPLITRAHAKRVVSRSVELLVGALEP